MVAADGSVVRVNQESAMDQDVAGLSGSGRRWSLRDEWSRAFTIMLLLLLGTAGATIVGVGGVVDEVRGTGLELHRQFSTVAALRSDLVDHERVGHKLLADGPVDRAGFLLQQQRISALFDQTAAVFPTSQGMRATVLKAHQSWKNSLMTSGLLGDQLRVLHGDHPVQNEAFGSTSDDARALLDSLGGTSLQAMDTGLARGADLERMLIAVLAGLFLIGLSVTVYFRRRMTRDLLRPLASMHDCVARLQAGEYDSRIEIARRDELGELAQAFNEMAEAIHRSHLELTARATRDGLTGLANRTTLTESLTAAFRSGSERRARQESLLFIDIDDFKDVNDTLGHEGGDALLLQLATRLNACVRPQDLVARLGGDEFAILVTDDSDGLVAAEVADRVLDALRAPFVIAGELMAVTVSIGVAQRRPETLEAAELLRQADFAMYMAKGGGKARYQLFDAQVHDSMVERSALKNNLAQAVASGQLRLEYQPVADLRTGEILGVEALVRWQHPTLGLLAPETFIPLAEESGDIDAIGCWVLHTATRQVAAWRQTMQHCNGLWVSVNLSALQLANPRSLAAVQHILADPLAEAGKVVLEVTETALAADIQGGIEGLATLKDLGVRIAIDDFGTGSSSLSTLAELPVDILKIDGSFIHDPSPAEAETAPMVSAPLLQGILGLARNLSLDVIAEGIEHPDQLDLLQSLGCAMGQGYLLAWPAPAHVLEARLASGGLLQLGPSAEINGALEM